MLREFQSKNGKNVPADYKAKVKMQTGMGIIKDRKNKEAIFPAEETANDIYLVQKPRIPTDINCARTDMSDYDDNFVNVKIGELIKLETYTNPESFGTDAKGVVEAGKVVSVGTDGLWMTASPTVASKYFYVGDYVDNGHTLMKIEVLETPINNA